MSHIIGRKEEFTKLEIYSVDRKHAFDLLAVTEYIIRIFIF